ncbi:MAG: HPF/RaiA family ribosome-associated protein [Alphaproteobacteria bacterium]|uniref:HPF/RaiA family ribosome-associated protein n=1 Tax=Candidatus Nitrobium versatile TaxID=2884831 RepID=A0A953SHV7_9BACT|nr:HPF/RaiA family ribosome-associated protein [Candidatus Nitrobium versatile]
MELQITARTIELDDWLKDEITRRAEKLDNFYQRIVHCRVVVEVPHRHKRDGVLYNIRIDLHVPGAVLMVEREPSQDLTAAIRDAFDAARRKLEDYSRQQRGDIKRHGGVPHARVSALFPEDGYGFLTTPDGSELYFHENSVLNGDFKHLHVGAEVRFAEEKGEKGPQASTVSLVKR